MNKYFYFNIFLLVFANTISCQEENPPRIELEKKINYKTELISGDISIPWGMDFINSKELLVTEKSGILYKIINGKKIKIDGIPQAYVRGQGGLLDVALHPDYTNNNLIYFTMSSQIGEGSGGNTALYIARLIDDKLIDLRLLYKAEPNTKKGQHWGSKIVFDNNGYLFFSIGDRGNRDVNPQNIKLDGGKIYRLNLDGTIPDDNPFINSNDAKSAIYSYGHRNPQGLFIHPETGVLWEHEHGPRGGDEINLPEKGKNYGWPIITYGINYIGTTITDQTQAPGMEQPIYYWKPSIAPSGMTFLTSDIYPEWKGNLFVGSLVFEYLERLVIENNKVIYREKILDGIGRVRNVKQGPDGYLYLGVEGKGIIKILPLE
jgi:glucose/arabinose dehydrogenase